MPRSALFITTVPITLEAFLLPFAGHFRAHGWRIDALTRDATQYPALLGAFDTLYDITWSRNPLALSDHFDTWERVRRTVIEGGYDVVHVHTPIAAFVTRFALRSMPRNDRPAIIYTAHGFHFYRGQGRLAHALFRTMERTAAPWTDFLVTINHEDYEAARAFRRMPEGAVRLIPGIGVDVEAYDPARVPTGAAARIREEFAVPESAFMLTMVAEFGPVKRHRHLFEALARTTRDDIVLVLVGSGPLEAELREHATRLGIDDRVRWAGYRRDIPAILAASDALTLVSEREGLPRSILEAMAAGLPVIGTKTRGITDAVQPETGWLVAKDDPAALAAAIDEAARNRAECRKRGAAGRKRALADYSIGQVLEAYEQLYAEAISSPTSDGASG